MENPVTTSELLALTADNERGIAVAKAANAVNLAVAAARLGDPVAVALLPNALLAVESLTTMH